MGYHCKWAKVVDNCCPALTRGSKSQITQIRDIDVFRLDVACSTSKLSLEQKHSSCWKIFKSRHHDYCIDVNVNDRHVLLICVWSVCNGRTFSKISKFEGLWKISGEMWWFALWFIVRVPLSALKVYKIWLPWLLIYMRIHEMFNVTDGRDINFGVDFLLLFVHFYLKSLNSPNIFNYRC